MNNSYGLLSESSLKYSGRENKRLSLFELSNNDADWIILLYQVITAALPVESKRYGGSVVILGQEKDPLE